MCALACSLGWSLRSLPTLKSLVHGRHEWSLASSTRLNASVCGVSEMTDEELIALLRDDSGNWLTDAAADRIEELLRKNDNLFDLAQQEHSRAERLEAQVAALMTVPDEIELYYIIKASGAKKRIDVARAVSAHLEPMRRAILALITEKPHDRA